MSKFSLHVDGVKVSVCGYGNTVHNFTEVFVNNFESCYSIPSHLAKLETRSKFKTSGHTFEIK